jgi:hypothetical protein
MLGIIWGEPEQWLIKKTIAEYLSMLKVCIKSAGMEHSMMDSISTKAAVTFIGFGIGMTMSCF